MNPVSNILIVDDSKVYRYLLSSLIESEEDINIVGLAEDGQEALTMLKANPEIDLVTLDLEMPNMNGIETLNAIQALNEKNNRHIGCLMVSALTQKGSETTIEALESGAFDFITKPVSDSMEESQESLKRQILTKTRCFRVQSRNQTIISETKTPPSKPSRPPIKTKQKTDRLAQSGAKIILIGSSTGGPKALMHLIPELCRTTSLPIVIVQHMPPKFTRSLADSLDKKSTHHVIEIEGDEILSHNHVYIAPGGKHAVLKKNKDQQIVTALNEQPPENGCRPAADVLFRSAATLYKDDSAIALILTGMGCDGAKGLASLKRAGAQVIAQDEDSSVVWGMPGAAVEANVVDQIVPLNQINQTVARMLS